VGPEFVPVDFGEIPGIFEDTPADASFETACRKNFLYFGTWG
jgi:hypothetical protein